MKVSNKMKRNVRKVYLGTVWPEDVDVNELVFTKMITIVSDQSGGKWSGTMTNLMTALNKVSSKRQREILPGSPSALRVVLNRVANRLRSRGIGVKFNRTTDHTRTRYVRFTQ
jgi:hypothetical protein